MNYLNFDLYKVRAARDWYIPAFGDVIIRVRERGIHQCVTGSRRVKTSLSSAPESGLLEVSTRLSLSLFSRILPITAFNNQDSKRTSGGTYYQA